MHWIGFFFKCLNQPTLLHLHQNGNTVFIHLLGCFFCLPSRSVLTFLVPIFKGLWETAEDRFRIWASFYCGWGLTYSQKWKVHSKLRIYPVVKKNVIAFFSEKNKNMGKTLPNQTLQLVTFFTDWKQEIWLCNSIIILFMILWFLIMFELILLTLTKCLLFLGFFHFVCFKNISISSCLFKEHLASNERKLISLISDS